MNKKLLFFVLVFMLSSSACIYAQKTVTGTVSDNNGLPLPGVNLVIKGTVNGASTDFDGNYSISTQTVTDVLVISYVGYKTQEISVGNQSVINVALQEDTEALSEVVITAQGIKKSKKALGYAITTLDSEDVEQRPEADLARTLQGKIAGVNISAVNGETGGGTSIRIRSSLSINQSNAPLIVVNGVPFSGLMGDLDANDIKSMSVLKGLNASVLYGSEGRNGVILIETKSGAAVVGEKSFKATVSTTTYVNQVANLPEYQNKYGAGSEFGYVGGNLGNWGPAFTELDEVPHPYAIYGDIFPEYKDKMIPYEASPNNVKDFFNTGRGTITSANISSTQEKTAFNMSVGYTDEQGIIGNNDLKRFNLGIGGQIKLTDNFNVSATLNYSTRKVNRLQADEIFNLLTFIPRDLDLINLPYQHPQTGASIYYRSSENPLWVMNNTGLYDDVVRVFGTINAKYNFTDKLSLSYRAGVDNDSQDEFDYSNKGGFGDNEFGFLDLDYDKAVTVDQSIILALNNLKIGEHIGLDSQIGINSKFLKGKSHSSNSSDQIVFGFQNPRNYRTTQASYSDYNENLAGAFGQFEFSYDSFFYLTLSGRNDWGSTVEKENQSLFYPGASFSFIPTSAFNLNSKVLNYLKLRGAYGTSSGFPSRFKTRQTLDTNPRRFVDANGQVLVTNSSDDEYANPDLSPELHREFELGIEARLFNNRVNLEASAFKRISEDQILEASLAPETGYTSTTINAGRIDTKGLEIDLGIDVIKTNNFNWNFRNLFTAYESLVVSLPQSELELSINGEGRGRFAIEGQPFGVMKGSYALRDDEGNFLINPDIGELYISSEQGKEDIIIGDPTPDWTLTTINSFSYKNFNLSAQFEYTHGGDILGLGVQDLLERGVTRDTENREGSFIVPGVYGDPVTGTALLDVNGDKIPNTIQQNAQRTVFSNYYNADELSVFDGSVLRLREIALGYTFHKATNSKIPFETMTLTLSGRNLWFNAPDFPKYSNYDPENDNGLGDQTVPTTKRFALGFAVTF
ncbi:SusC/RagA family TonB-linked outer membrane protein [Algibacter miyuki]|uniref:SusC/RagA family TonB-linked outer membrane protein n=1 Tax=Algibacter miyuki TaxID=1306933 RepID=A0ABV5GVJ8_9FLAO|nr:SusC/RagA family TonB-linked outer membrane protein [Algibacter miyuki]MDN3664984.1 SusC/RagA family TonB-linked outer membrane protein [Algibacter miyuki]